MRVLLDECVPRPLKKELSPFEIRSVQDMGWSGVKNSALLELAAEQFDAVFTVDRGLGAALDATGASVGVVVLAAGSSDPESLRPHMTAVVEALRRVRPGETRRVSNRGSRCRQWRRRWTFTRSCCRSGASKCAMGFCGARAGT